MKKTNSTKVQKKVTQKPVITQTSNSKRAMDTFHNPKPKMEIQQISFESIAQCAYFLWKNDGCKSSSDREYWLRAEKILANEIV